MLHLHFSVLYVQAFTQPWAVTQIQWHWHGGSPFQLEMDLEHTHGLLNEFYQASGTFRYVQDFKMQRLQTRFFDFSFSLQE